jgi:hypothetical protein
MASAEVQLQPYAPAGMVAVVPFARCQKHVALENEAGRQ